MKYLDRNYALKREIPTDIPTQIDYLCYEDGLDEFIITSDKIHQNSDDYHHILEIDFDLPNIPPSCTIFELNF